MKFGSSCVRTVLLALVLLANGAAPIHAQSSFFRDLVLKPRASQADGVRMVAILLGHKQGELESDMDLLRNHGILPREWSPSADEPLSKGYEALLLVRALELDGGVGARIWGWSKRRAFRELVQLRIMPPKGGPHAKLTGPEVITLLDRAAQRRKSHQAHDAEHEGKGSNL